MRMISTLKFSSFQRRAYTLVLILGLFIFVLPSCTEEVAPSQSIKIKKAGFEKFTIEDLPAMANAIAPFVNPNLEQKAGGKLIVSPQNESELSKALNYDEVLARYDGKGNTNYGMMVADNDDNPFSFSNFIIMQDSTGAFRTPYVLTYHMDKDFIEEYLRDHDISKFRGKITTYVLGPMGEQKVDYRNPDTNDPDNSGSGTNPSTPPTHDGTVVCEKVESSGPAAPIDSGGSGGFYYVCEKIMHTVYDYSTEQGKNEVWFTYVTWENCQPVFLNEFAAAGSSVCPFGTEEGEIPIISPITTDLGPYLCTDIKWKSVGNSQTAQISKLGLTLMKGRNQFIGFVALGTVCVALPNVNSFKADLIFETSFNRSVDEFLGHMNSRTPGYQGATMAELSLKLKRLIEGNLAKSLGLSGSVAMANGPCLGDIEDTVAKYCGVD